MHKKRSRRLLSTRRSRRPKSIRRSRSSQKIIYLKGKGISHELKGQGCSIKSFDNCVKSRKCNYNYKTQMCKPSRSRHYKKK